VEKKISIAHLRRSGIIKRYPSVFGHYTEIRPVDEHLCMTSVDNDLVSKTSRALV
jgi:hypothetical protein